MPSKEFYEYREKVAVNGTPPFPEGTRFQNGTPVLPEDYVAEVPALPEGYTGGEVFLNGVRGLKMSRNGNLPDVCYLHIHGGGYTIGSAMENLDFLDYISKGCRLDCFAVDYKLAPWQSYHNILKECTSFYLGLRDLGYSRIIVGGESAGAALTISVTQTLRDRGLPLPLCIWCSSPVMILDYYKKEMFHTDFISDTWPSAAKVVFPEEKDSLLKESNPLLGGFEKFPPTLLQCGSAESLCAINAGAVYEFCRAGVDLSFRCGQEMHHCYPMAIDAFPEAKEAMDDIVLFFKRHL